MLRILVLVLDLVAALLDAGRERDLLAQDLVRRASVNG